MNKVDLIAFLPIWSQNLLVSSWGFYVKKSRYNKHFWKLLRELEERLSWSENDIREFQNEKLREVIKHCYHTVPYYKDVFNSLKLRPDDFKIIEDLHKLPIINRSILTNNMNKFFSNVVPKRLWKNVRSGGTTGLPLCAHVTHDCLKRLYATWWRYRRQHGINLNTLCGLWAQTPIVHPKQKDPPYWRFNRPGHEIRLSISHLNPATFRIYLEELEKYQVQWIHGHPSMVSLLADYMIRFNTSIKSVQWITTGAENLMAHQNEKIYKAFGMIPTQHYGNTEAIAIFSQCKDGSIHVDEDFSIVEFLPHQNTEKDEQYRVVGTSLWNPAMPLLRYDIADLVTLSKKRCSCGRWGRIINSIDGRGDDSVICNDGTRITGFNWVFSLSRNIEMAQIYQKDRGSITVRIVRSAGYNRNDEKRILRGLRKRFSEDQMQVKITYVYKIERTARGKHRMVVSELKDQSVISLSEVRELA